MRDESQVTENKQTHTQTGSLSGPTRVNRAHVLFQRYHSYVILRLQCFVPSESYLQLRESSGFLYRCEVKYQTLVYCIVKKNLTVFSQLFYILVFFSCWRKTLQISFEPWRTAQHPSTEGCLEINVLHESQSMDR